MQTDGVERRLAAILTADVVGYARLMGEDEAGTLARLKGLRSEVIDPTITRYGGRIVKLMGDGMLAEFPSVVDAVRCAVEIQGAAADRAGDLPEGQRIEFRVGINLGDVIVEGEDIYGDGVNVAARLEGLAEPGGICISGLVHESIAGKLDVPFSDAGAHQVKNIARPIQVWRWHREQSRPAAAINSNPPPRPDKPSIAVLAFENMSGDREQEYFADGIAEDIITALSRFRAFFVIARNSSFTYKGQAVDVKKVSRDLGVRYVVEGSVRKAGNRVRVTAQLIDADSGAHVWAERYDRDLDDIFAVQDEIARNIVASIAPEFESAEMQRASRAGGTDLSVWDLIMQARWHLGAYTRDSCASAQRLLLEATTLDPRNVQAHSLLAVNQWIQSIYSWGASREQSLETALQAGRRAVSLDSGDAMAQAALGLAFIINRQHDEAIETLNRAVHLNPNLALAHGWLGIAYTFACEFEPAVQAAAQAIQLSPRDLDKPFWMVVLSFADFIAGRYEEVLDKTQAILQERPEFPTAHRHRAAAFAMLGRQADAGTEIDELIRLVPGLTVSQVRQQLPLKDPEVEARWLGALRKAGLPE